MSKSTIICHSFPAWDAPYVKSTLEIMCRLAATHRVILLDYHYTWKDVFFTAFAPWREILGFRPRWRKLTTRFGEIEVYNTPPIIPVNWVSSPRLFRWLTQLNAWWLKSTIKKINQSTLGQHTTLVNAMNPVYGNTTDTYWEVDKRVYYCYDEITGMDWCSKWGPDAEKAYLKKVDQVIVTSTALQRAKKSLNPACVLVKNGVDLDRFQSQDITKTKNKVIGYVGAIDDRLDYELIAQTATAFPECEIQMVGPVVSEIATQRLSGLKNVRFMGSFPQEQVPGKIKNMDLCLIPFRKTALTKAIYPLKVNEYLAMGKPVVTTDFADLSDFESIIAIASTADDFTEAIGMAMKYNNRMRIQKRIGFAKSNGWDDRVRLFQSYLVA